MALGFSEPISAVVLGARGGIGGAMVEEIARALPGSHILATSRDAAWAERNDGLATRLRVDVTDEASVRNLSSILSERDWSPQLVFNATGFLQGQGTDGVQYHPERSIRAINLGALQHNFAVNTFAVALLVRELFPLMPRSSRCVFASLSARVGSIGDNRRGGWHSYRASKAAQNMILRGAAIEAKRTHPHMCCVALHPGTVRSNLSAPFTAGDKAERLPYLVQTPRQSAQHLARVIADLGPADSGYFYAWDGAAVPW